LKELTDVLSQMPVDSWFYATANCTSYEVMAAAPVR